MIKTSLGAALSPQCKHKLSIIDHYSNNFLSFFFFLRGWTGIGSNPCPSQWKQLPALALITPYICPPVPADRVRRDSRPVTFSPLLWDGSASLACKASRRWWWKRGKEIHFKYATKCPELQSKEPQHAKAHRADSWSPVGERLQDGCRQTGRFLAHSGVNYILSLNTVIPQVYRLLNPTYDAPVVLVTTCIHALPRPCWRKMGFI